MIYVWLLYVTPNTGAEMEEKIMGIYRSRVAANLAAKTFNSVLGIPLLPFRIEKMPLLG